MKRVIVCGGRSFGVRSEAERMAASDEFFRLGPDVILVHGAASGADSLAESWRELTGVQTERHYADWSRFGRKAGPLRNQKMIDAGADLVIAFPGGRGTADMVRRARKAGIQVREIVPHLSTDENRDEKAK